MKVVGSTMDDSFGESFDKVSKMLKLGYPGGPVIEKYAINGDDAKYELPIPLRQSPLIQFSYSGLKNAVRLVILKEEENNNITEKSISDISASFQKTAIEHILMKLKKYFKTNPPTNFAIVGGASANKSLRSKVQTLCDTYDAQLLLAPMEFCSDNAAMIGRVAIEQYLINDFVTIEDIEVQSRTDF